MRRAARAIAIVEISRISGKSDSLAGCGRSWGFFISQSTLTMKIAQWENHGLYILQQCGFCGRDWASDWTPRLEAMKEQAEQEELEQQMKMQRGFWPGC